jgi:hypothetical protein
MHPTLIAGLVEDRRRSCSCGAVTAQSHQLCRNCRARMTWCRHMSRHSESIVQYLADQRPRAWTWTLTAATSTLRVIGKGARS